MRPAPDDPDSLSLRRRFDDLFLSYSPSFIFSLRSDLCFFLRWRDVPSSITTSSEAKGRPGGPAPIDTAMSPETLFNSSSGAKFVRRTTFFRGKYLLSPRESFTNNTTPCSDNTEVREAPGLWNTEVISESETTEELNNPVLLGIKTRSATNGPFLRIEYIDISSNKAKISKFSGLMHTKVFEFRDKMICLSSALIEFTKGSLYTPEVIIWEGNLRDTGATHWSLLKRIATSVQGSNVENASPRDRSMAKIESHRPACSEKHAAVISISALLERRWEKGTYNKWFHTFKCQYTISSTMPSHLPCTKLRKVDQILFALSSSTQHPFYLYHGIETCLRLGT